MGLVLLCLSPQPFDTNRALIFSDLSYNDCTSLPPEIGQMIALIYL